MSVRTGPRGMALARWAMKQHGLHNIYGSSPVSAKRVKNAAMSQIGSRISFFLGEARCECFSLSPMYLLRVGSPWELIQGSRSVRPRSARSAQRSLSQRSLRPWAWKSCPVACLGWPGVEGKLVWVRRQVQKVDVNAVSASIDSRLYFTFGAGDTGRAAWHAVKVHNVCRPMSAGEDSF